MDQLGVVTKFRGDPHGSWLGPTLKAKARFSIDGAYGVTEVALSSLCALR